MFKIKKIWYIAAAIVVILLLLFSRVAKKTEGMKSSSTTANMVELPDKIKGAVSDIESSLLLDSHKGDYEDMIINLNDGIDYQILHTIKQGGESISKNATSDESFKTVRKINELRKLKTALKESMTFLDSR